MIKSMTGYGRAQKNFERHSINIELRCVNHRYFDCVVRVPRIYVFLEETVKSVVQGVIARGKVDVFVTIEHEQSDNVSISLNRPVLDGYIGAITEMRGQYSLRDDMSLMQMARLPEVFSVVKEQEDMDELKQSVSEVLLDALSDFSGMRESEGGRLGEDILQRASEIESLVAVVEERSPKTVIEYRERLYARMREVLENTELDEGRILLEAAIFADKVAVSEETVRLRSHISQLRNMLATGGAVGRKLDFLIQEMNREANTIGSKAGDIELSRVVVDMKSEIEKMREQVQNIE